MKNNKPAPRLFRSASEEQEFAETWARFQQLKAFGGERTAPVVHTNAVELERDLLIDELNEFRALLTGRMKRIVEFKNYTKFAVEGERIYHAVVNVDVCLREAVRELIKNE